MKPFEQITKIKKYNKISNTSQSERKPKHSSNVISGRYTNVPRKSNPKMRTKHAK